ncbi:DUF5958 family protein [Polluticaenibacter yanchengensis]|uniref:DUF5958 family protein n=1 Tax=Polluticaenibacter yanchengensis TaxID=3014562 RepID=A0ABT4UMX4_9BACT|nr:DUF5958 family protein [Chitinophagaceae bacterium LY-5]
MLSKELILINKYAQDQISFEEIISWFDQKNEQSQFDLLVTVISCTQQAHPTNEMTQQAINTMPIKTSMTPVVLLSKYQFNIAISKILQLPQNELRKSFITILHLFKLADTDRRNKYCKNECYHEWHNLDKSTPGNFIEG